MAPFDRSHTSSYLRSIVEQKYRRKFNLGDQHRRQTDVRQTDVRQTDGIAMT